MRWFLFPFFSCGPWQSTHFPYSESVGFSPTFDEFVKIRKTRFPVIFAKGGIQSFQLGNEDTDSDLHRSEEFLRYRKPPKAKAIFRMICTCGGSPWDAFIIFFSWPWWLSFCAVGFQTQSWARPILRLLFEKWNTLSTFRRIRAVLLMIGWKK